MNVFNSWLNRCNACYSSVIPLDENIEDLLIDEVLAVNKKGFTVRTANHAHLLIKELFDYYVDDSCLVITTKHEHPTVKEIIDECKNVYYLSDVNAFDVHEACKPYKSVFCYTIGIANDFLYETSVNTLHNLRCILDSLRIPSIFCLDDCQSFLVRFRDYSMFDYVVTTAHAYSNYDCGCVYCKHDIPIGSRETPVKLLQSILGAKQAIPNLQLFDSVIRGSLPYTVFRNTKSSIFSSPVVSSTVVSLLHNLGLFKQIQCEPNGHACIPLRGFNYYKNPSEFIKQIENLVYVVNHEHD